MREGLTLVDTSSWVEALRKQGRVDVRERVRKLILDGDVACCDFVLLELWNGSRGEYEGKKLSELEREIPILPTTEDVWSLARSLARKCRKAGKTVPGSDLLIAACALYHGARLEYCDAHFDVIMKISDGENS